ncbi:hypothetical protein K9B32_02230 [Rhizobium sp. 3T7]|nr:hypothetical protein [Rhizobium sp. 3T7]
MAIEFRKTIPSSSIALLAAVASISAIPAHAGGQVFDELRSEHPHQYKAVVNWHIRRSHSSLCGSLWTTNFNEKVFAEAGFGGAWHNGELEGNTDGANLGCRSFLTNI